MKRDLVRAPPLWELKHRFLLPAVIFKVLPICGFRILQVGLVRYLQTAKDLSQSPFENANFIGYEVPLASKHFH